MPKTAAPKPADVRATELSSWPEVDLSLIRLHNLDYRRKRLETDMNAALDLIKKQFAPRLEDLAQEDAALRRTLEKFARAHLEAFSEKRSCERLHGILSFRTSPRAVKRLNLKWTMRRILSAVDSVFGGVFTRIEKSLAKDVILSEYSAGRVTDEQLSQVGLKVVQDEVFNVELKYETTPEAQQ